MTLRAPAYLLARSAPCGRLPDQGRNESGVIVASDTSSHLNAFVVCADRSVSRFSTGNVDRRARLRTRFSLKQPDRLCLLDRIDFSQHFENALRNATIDVHYGNRFPRFAFAFFVGCAHTSSQRKVRDVDFVLTKNRADLPDHTGHVTVPHVDQVAFQRRFYINAIDIQEARSCLCSTAPVTRCSSEEVFSRIDNTLPAPPPGCFAFVDSITRNPREAAIEAALTRFAFSSKP